MPVPASAPATKADLALLKTDLSEAVESVKTDVAVLKTDVAVLKTDVAGLKTDVAGLKTDVAGLKTDMADVKSELSASTKRLALGILETNVRMDRLAEGLREEMRALRSDVSDKLDTAVSRMETLWRESVVLPRVVDDHERRITALEARPPR